MLKGSFYHYFPSKKDLARAALEQCCEQFRTTYNQIFSPLNPPLQRFEKMADCKIEMQEELLRENGYVMGCPTAGFRNDLSNQAENSTDMGLGNIRQESLTYFKAALKDLQDAGMIDSDIDIDLRAQEIFIFITGTMTTARMTNDLAFLKTSFKPSLMRIIGIKNYELD